MSNFRLESTWLDGGGSAIDATLARLKIVVANRAVSEYQGENEVGSETLEIPAYYLAEWIAENWWSILWEPRKAEDAGDDLDFLSRHSIVVAQHGFALPAVTIIPQDALVRVHSLTALVRV